MYTRPSLCHLIQHIHHASFEGEITAADAHTVKMPWQCAYILGYGHIVVVKYDDKRQLALSRIVESLEGHSAGKRPVAYHRHDTSRRALYAHGAQHAQRRRNGSAGMAGIEGIKFAHKHIIELCDFISGIQAEIGKEKFTYESHDVDHDLYDAIKNMAFEKLQYALDTDDKNVRDERIGEITDEIINMCVSIENNYSPEVIYDKRRIETEFDQMKYFLIGLKKLTTNQKRFSDIQGYISEEQLFFVFACGLCSFFRNSKSKTEPNADLIYDKYIKEIYITPLLDRFNKSSEEE